MRQNSDLEMQLPQRKQINLSKTYVYELVRCLAVKSADCFSKGPEFTSQQPHGGSQPSVMSSDALFGVSEDSYSVLTYNNKYIFGPEQAGTERAGPNGVSRGPKYNSRQPHEGS